MPTATVGIRTNDEIILGTDSEVADAQGNEVGSICKIRQLGSNLFFTMMGMSSRKDTKFDAFAIAEKPSHSRKDILRQIDAIESAMKAPVEKQLSLIKKEAPEVFQELAVGQDPVTLIFAAFEKGGVALYGRTFHVLSIAKNGNVNVAVERHACPGKDCPNGKVRFLGSPVGQPDSAVFDRLYPRWETRSTLEVAQQFMRMVKDEPTVKPPFRFLRITSKGAEWIGEHEGCPEIWK
jgi:hypothetical protein